jgi:hypothetical protein
VDTEFAFLMSPTVLIIAAALMFTVITGLAARIALFVEDLSHRQSPTKRPP